MKRLRSDRALLLNRKLREAANLQPEITRLQRLLLTLGGIELVAPPGPDSAVRLLIDHRFAMSGPVKRWRMVCARAARSKK